MVTMIRKRARLHFSKFCRNQREFKRMINNTETIRLSINEITDKLKCSNATVYNYAKKYEWQKEKDETGKSFMYVPVAYLEKHSSKKEEPSSKDSLEFDTVISKLEEAYTRERQVLVDSHLKEKELLDKRIKDLEKLLKKTEENADLAKNEMVVWSDKYKKLTKNRSSKTWWEFWR